MPAWNIMIRIQLCMRGYVRNLVRRASRARGHARPGASPCAQRLLTVGASETMIQPLQSRCATMCATWCAALRLQAGMRGPVHRHVRVALLQKKRGSNH